MQMCDDMREHRKDIIRNIQTSVPAVFLWLLLLTCAWVQNAFADTGTVILEDPAGLLSQTDETVLLTAGNTLSEKTGWDVYLVTTDDTSGREARDYAEDYYMAHYHQDDGFVCLIDMDNREIYLATSGDVIYYVTDERKEKILDAGFEAVSEGDYSGCFKAMLSGINSAYQAGIDSSNYRYDEDTGKVVYYTPPKAVTLTEAGLSLLLGIVSALGFGGIVSASYKKKGQKYRYNVAANTTLVLKDQRDNLINRFTTTRRIPKNPPPSSGGRSFSGGHRSTTHRGSGGHTFGGGGRKF